MLLTMIIRNIEEFNIYLCFINICVYERAKVDWVRNVHADNSCNCKQVEASVKNRKKFCWSECVGLFLFSVR